MTWRGMVRMTSTPENGGCMNECEIESTRIETHENINWTWGEWAFFLLRMFCFLYSFQLLK